MRDEASRRNRGWQLIGAQVEGVSRGSWEALTGGGGNDVNLKAHISVIRREMSGKSMLLTFDNCSRLADHPHF